MTKQTNYLEKAVRLAVKKHKGQVDKGGKPYIFHLFRVMEKMPSDELKAVAVLHDLLEDTKETAATLAMRGFPESIIETLKILNKKQYDSYEEYIDQVAGNHNAARVKMADLEDNMNITRLEEFNDNLVKHLKKYHKAWKRLNRVLNPEGEEDD